MLEFFHIFHPIYYRDKIHHVRTPNSGKGWIPNEGTPQ